MPSAAELALLYADDLAAHGRTVSVRYSVSPTENPLSGADSSLGYTTASVTAVCGDIRTSYDSVGAGGSSVGREVRDFGFRLSDLNAQGCPSSGLPEPGKMRITDGPDTWTGMRIDPDGDRGWVRVVCKRASGPRREV